MNLQTTIVLLKPDALQRDLLGEVIGRFERKGLKIVGLKFIQLSDALLDEHYAHIADKPFYAGVKDYMMQSPVVAIALQGPDAVDEVRKVVGVTDPRKADAGTIRADFSMHIEANIIHASDTAENAEAEQKRFFGDDEIFDYKKITDRFVLGETA